ncbi:MAG: hypothetical protein KKE23_00750 [Nanoarchaeota archaeon]|nr:hypothetical protein [Nanoarchaeota archaeon]
MKLLLDTNFWIYTAKYKLFDKLKEMNVELILISPIMRELETLSMAGNDRIDSSVALEMIKRWNIKTFEIKERKTDEAILKFASERKSEIKVATMDKKLSERLSRAGVRIMKIRQKKDFFV